jgi:poly-gamma-glutamate synthesis protein (capsule biosynthesis protein)
MRNLTYFILLLLTFSCTEQTTRGKEITTVAEPEDSTSEVTLLIGGDMMMHMPQINCGHRGGSEYNFEDVFSLVKPEVEKADIAIANFETTLAPPPYTGYPRFCCPTAYLDAIINAGFDILTTANNHCCDKGGTGLTRTIEEMDARHVLHLGTYRNKAERDSLHPLIVEKNGIRIALLSLTYGTNGIPVPKPYYVNHLDTAEIAADVAMAKLLKSDVIIALPHWGTEYLRTPDKGQKALTDWMLSHGVDHVIGGHPHVIEPFEVREIDGEKRMVAYSLGNYVSAQSKPNTDGGSMLRMTLRKQGGKTILTDCSYTLHWVSPPKYSGKQVYKVIPAGYPDEQLTPAERNARNTFIQSTRKLMLEHNKGIEEYTY